MLTFQVADLTGETRRSCLHQACDSAPLALRRLVRGAESGPDTRAQKYLSPCTPGGVLWGCHLPSSLKQEVGGWVLTLGGGEQSLVTQTCLNEPHVTTVLLGAMSLLLNNRLGKWLLSPRLWGSTRSEREGLRGRNRVPGPDSAPPSHTASLFVHR